MNLIEAFINLFYEKHTCACCGMELDRPFDRCLCNDPMCNDCYRCSEHCKCKYGTMTKEELGYALEHHLG